MTIAGTIGFLGFGNMGAALLEGLIEKGVLSPGQAVVFDPDPGRCAAAEGLGASVAPNAGELARQSDTLLLAVKPQMMSTALKELEPGLRPELLFISIAAGISIARLREQLGEAARIIRVMPNTPALVSAGAAGIAPGPGCLKSDIELARRIFEAVGTAEMVEEKDIDAVTALSGSGPAYFFYMVECLIKAAVAEGLDKGAATRLAAQTFQGASKLLCSGTESAEVLRQRVTSKGGTTEAALRQFQEHGFEDIVRAAVRAAAARSRELGA